MTSELRIQQIHDQNSFTQLKPHWQKLFATTPYPSAFLTWEWLHAWWQVNQADKKLRIFTVWRGEQLAGIAPLMLETRNRVIRVLTNLGTPQSDIGGFIHAAGDQAAITALFAAVVAEANQWDILELNELRKDWLTPISLPDAFPGKRFTVITQDNQHYYIELTGGTWDAYSTKLSKKFRHNLRRAMKLAEEIGPVVLHRYHGSEVTWDIFQTVVEINRNAHYPRLYNSASEQALIKALIEHMAADQRFDVYILSVNEKPIAYEYGFRNGSQFEDWRSGFDIHSLPSNISIGKALAMQVVQACLTSNFTEIDFLRGDEAYKQEWQPLTREFSQVRVFNNKKPVARLAHLWLTQIKPRLKEKSAESGDQPTAPEIPTS